MARSLRFWWILSAALLWLPSGQAEPLMQNGFPVIAVAELPAEARETLQAIKQGGPFAYPRDGAPFKNYERILPQQPRGLYREYTVKTPGARNRGARIAERRHGGGREEQAEVALGKGADAGGKWRRHHR